VARTNAAGQLTGRTSYEPYGATAAGTNPGGNGFTGIGFTGHVNDAETGLVHMQQRYYDPIAARFLSVDPVVTDASNGTGFNLYEYANNNPYRYTDPDGMYVTCGQFIQGCTTYWVNPGSGNGWNTEQEPTPVAVTNSAPAAATGPESDSTPIVVAGGAPARTRSDDIGGGGVGTGPIVRGASGKAGVAEARARLEDERKARMLNLNIDKTGKVHGEIPSNVQSGATTERLRELSHDLRKSIEMRKLEQNRLGEHGPHRERIRQEEQLLRQIDKALSGS
jgi:RHS repeat-associated protein